MGHGGTRVCGSSVSRAAEPQALLHPDASMSFVDVDVLTEAIDRLHGSDPSAYADPESIETLQRQLARLDAFVTEATAAFDAAGNWVPDGARSTTAWLVTRCRL